MVTVRYSGPARGAQMLAREIGATGMRVDAAPPQERRGLGHDVVFVLMRVESDVEAGLVGAAARGCAAGSQGVPGAPSRSGGRRR